MGTENAEATLDTIRADLEAGMDARNPVASQALAATNQSLGLIDRLLGMVGMNKGPKAPMVAEDDKVDDSEEEDQGQPGMWEDMEKGCDDMRKGMMQTCSKCGHKEPYKGEIPEGLKKGPSAEMIDVSELLHRVDVGVRSLPEANALNTATLETLGALQASIVDLKSAVSSAFGQVEQLMKGPVAVASPDISAADLNRQAIVAAQRHEGGNPPAIEPLTKGERFEAVRNNLITGVESKFSDEDITKIRAALQAKRGNK